MIGCARWTKPFCARSGSTDVSGGTLNARVVQLDLNGWRAPITQRVRVLDQHPTSFARCHVTAPIALETMLHPRVCEHGQRLTLQAKRSARQQP